MLSITCAVMYNVSRTVRASGWPTVVAQWPEHWQVKPGAPATGLFCLCPHLLPCDKVPHTQYPPVVSVRSETESGQ